MLPALFALWLLPVSIRQAPAPIPDVPFRQDYHEAYPLGSPAENDVRSLCLDGEARVWAATADGVRYLDHGAWHTPAGGDLGLTYSLFRDARGVIWVGSWNGLYTVTPDGVSQPQIPDTPIGAIASLRRSDGGETLFAAGPHGVWRHDAGGWTRIPGVWNTDIRSILPTSNSRIWIGTTSGLYRIDVSGNRAVSTRYSTPSVLLSSNVNSLTLLPDGEMCVGSTGGVDFYRDTARVRSLAVKQGLPNRYVRSVAQDPSGRLWIATALGVVRYDGAAWSLRHSRRWLNSDDTRCVVPAPDGTVWVATGGGVDAIRVRTMTLAEKADEFLQKVRARHVRAPGLIGPAVLVTPGDLSKSFIEDDDNDGEHTGMYCAMESLRYAVTHAPEAREHARQAFHGLMELQHATGTPYFIARSVLPIGTAPRHEVDRTFTPEQIAETNKTDPREKIIEKRWVPSADGKWLWKRDASSDEVDGHMFGYATYFDLAADEDEKRLVADQVDRIIGGIVDHGYVLQDIDGKGTRWGNWSPESLNGDPNWFEERAGNSVEMIAFLGVAYHMTHKQKYVDAARYLIDKHHYDRNMTETNFNTPSERTHIEDELLTMVYHNLMSYLVMPSLKSVATASIRHWHVTCAPDGIPFYDFVYNQFSGDTVPLDRGVETLRDWPLDMIEWTVDNSKREDVKFDSTPGMDEGNLTRIVPRSEMGLCTWDQEPYHAVIGNNGQREEKGVDWLLAYWMGRYYGLLAAP